MRDYCEETKKRVEFIKNTLAESGAKGLVFGNSGGKDSALVGILCKLACENTVGVMMPCHSKINLAGDKDDATLLAQAFDIENLCVNLTEARQALIDAIGMELNSAALNNIAPRLRMTTLYAIAAKRGALVAGTGNKNEAFMGYFTKYGDGGYDFNAISDLTVDEIYDFLRYLKAPQSIIDKAPSAGLFDGQTDESEMGVTYKEITSYMEGKTVSDKSKAIIERYHRNSEHKRRLPKKYSE